MKIAGIIVEYNPFHYGHLHHINETKRLTKCDILIAVMSGDFNQRGCISIIDKKTKVETALNNGIDLVIELPVQFVLSNAEIFALKAVEILNYFNVSEIVFGSESNDLKLLETLSNTTIDYSVVKEKMKTGISYASSVSEMLGDLKANDILGLNYLKAIKKINPNIKATTIKRNNNYHSLEIQDISSASAIRNAIKNNIPYEKTTPIRISKPQFNNKYFDLLTYKLNFETEKLSRFYLVDEGIENHLKKIINISTDYDDFIDKAINKRYSRSRIERILISILLEIEKNIDFNSYKIRILGFKNKASFLISKQTKIAYKFKDLKDELYLKSTKLYSYNLPLKNKQELLKNELIFPIIK